MNIPAVCMWVSNHEIQHSLLTQIIPKYSSNHYDVIKFFSLRKDRFNVERVLKKICDIIKGGKIMTENDAS